MSRALIGGCLLAVLMLRPDGAAAQAASAQDQNANTGNDLFQPPANLCTTTRRLRAAAARQGRLAMSLRKRSICGWTTHWIWRRCGSWRCAPTCRFSPKIR